jgi:orotate phosphoribosyltransferase
MSSFNQAKFNSYVIQSGVIGFFEQAITLKSGRKSNWYVNWRRVAGDVYLIDSLSQYVLDFIKDLIQTQQLEIPDSIYGVPEGATKLGIICQYKWAKLSSQYKEGSHVLCMGRASPKQHGVPEDKYFVGMPRGKTLILEDVTTTGGSLLSTIDFLNDSGVEIIGALGLTNRMEKRDDGSTVEEAIRQKLSAGKPIKYYSMSNALDLLPELTKLKNPGKEVISSIIGEFKEYGVKEINL